MADRSVMLKGFGEGDISCQYAVVKQVIQPSSQQQSKTLALVFVDPQRTSYDPFTMGRRLIVIEMRIA